MSELNEATAKKGNGVFIGIILLLLVGIGVMAVMYSKKNSELNDCMNDNLALKQQMDDMNKMMAPYIKNHVNHAKLQGKDACHCPECASSNVVLSKYRTTLAGTIKTQLQCKDCRKYFTIRKSEYDKNFK